MKSNLIFKDGYAHQSALESDCDAAANTHFPESAAKNHSNQFRSDKLRQLRKSLPVEQHFLTMALSSLRGLLRRHIGLIVTITLLTSAMAGIGVSRMKTYYTATSSVILDQRDMRTLDNSSQRQNTLPPLNPDGEVELLKSNNVALRVVEKLRLMDDPEFVPPPGQLSKLISTIQSMLPATFGESERDQAAAATSPISEQASGTDERSNPSSKLVSNEATVALRNLVSNMEIRRLGLSDIISIRASALSPRRAAQIANAYAEAYLEEQAAPKLYGIERAERALSRQLEQLDRELKRSEAQIGLRQIYQDTQLRLQAISQQRYAVTPDARIASLALLPSGASGSGLPFDKILGMAGAVLASLILAFGIAYMRDMHTRRVQTEEEIEKISGVPNLASIPATGTLKFLRSRNTVDDIIEHPTSAYSDTIRRLYFNLQFMMEGSPHLGTVLVTSTEAGEGKTVLALSLARAAARGGAKVLIIDCNMSDPKLHDFLGLDNELGFVDLLTGACDERSIIQGDPKSLCKIVTGGNIRDIASEWLLQPARLRTILSRLEANFDLVILDAPAVKHSADAVMLTNCSDLTIFAVRTGWAHPNDIQSSIHQLQRVNGSEVVTVLTFVLR